MRAAQVVLGLTKLVLRLLLSSMPADAMAPRSLWPHDPAYARA